MKLSYPGSGECFPCRLEYHVVVDDLKGCQHKLGLSGLARSGVKLIEADKSNGEKSKEAADRDLARILARSRKKDGDDDDLPPSAVPVVKLEPNLLTVPRNVDHLGLREFRWKLLFPAAIFGHIPWGVYPPARREACSCCSLRAIAPVFRVRRPD